MFSNWWSSAPQAERPAPPTSPSLSRRASPDQPAEGYPGVGMPPDEPADAEPELMYLFTLTLCQKLLVARRFNNEMSHRPQQTLRNVLLLTLMDAEVELADTVFNLTQTDAATRRRLSWQLGVEEVLRDRSLGSRDQYPMFPIEFALLREYQEELRATRTATYRVASTAALIGGILSAKLATDRELRQRVTNNVRESLQRVRRLLQSKKKSNSSQRRPKASRLPSKQKKKKKKKRSGKKKRKSRSSRR